MAKIVLERGRKTKERGPKAETKAYHMVGMQSATVELKKD